MCAKQYAIDWVDCLSPRLELQVRVADPNVIPANFAFVAISYNHID